MKTSENTFVRAAKNYFKQNWGILAALLAMCVLFTIFGNNFLTTTNIINLLRTCATNCHRCPAGDHPGGNRPDRRRAGRAERRTLRYDL